MRETPTELFGPYHIYEKLGMGGMARVDRAELAGVDAIDGLLRPIALKRMLPHVADDADMVRAFVREARLASHLRHANVAQTYEVGRVGDTYFIAMELIAGRTLRDVLEQCAATTGPMPVPIALNVVAQICDALDYAHNLCDGAGQPLGIIHRDVSPSNIIVAEGGVVKLIDFGIAKASAAGMQTSSGRIKGKLGYMAPEYLAGQIDARADLFALGVIAHELLTNRPLFFSPDEMQTLNRVRSMPIAAPSQKNRSVPVEVDDIVMTALARDPDQRWQQAGALRSAIVTVTRRLGLDVRNQEVFEWIDLAFEQTRVRLVSSPSRETRRATPQGDREPRVAVQPVARASTPDQPCQREMTQLLDDEVRAPPQAVPYGTPAHSTAAQQDLAGPMRAATRVEVSGLRPAHGTPQNFDLPTTLGLQRDVPASSVTRQLGKRESPDSPRRIHHEPPNPAKPTIKSSTATHDTRRGTILIVAALVLLAVLAIVAGYFVLPLLT